MFGDRDPFLLGVRSYKVIPALVMNAVVFFSFCVQAKILIVSGVAVCHTCYHSAWSRGTLRGEAEKLDCPAQLPRTFVQFLPKCEIFSQRVVVAESKKKKGFCFTTCKENN